jgi:hypothetical protein
VPDNANVKPVLLPAQKLELEAEVIKLKIVGLRQSTTITALSSFKSQNPGPLALNVTGYVSATAGAVVLKGVPVWVVGTKLGADQLYVMVGGGGTEGAAFTIKDTACPFATRVGTVEKSIIPVIGIHFSLPGAPVTSVNAINEKPGGKW